PHGVSHANWRECDDGVSRSLKVHLGPYRSRSQLRKGRSHTEVPQHTESNVRRLPAGCGPIVKGVVDWRNVSLSRIDAKLRHRIPGESAEKTSQTVEARYFLRKLHRSSHPSRDLRDGQVDEHDKTGLFSQVQNQTASRVIAQMHRQIVPIVDVQADVTPAPLIKSCRAQPGLALTTHGLGRKAIIPGEQAFAKPPGHSHETVERFGSG